MSFTKCFRIDERLVHGQILKKWLSHNNIKTVLVIDDGMAKDPIIQSVLTMTLPKEITTEFVLVRDGASKIKSGDEQTLVMMKSIGDFWEIYKQIKDIKAVNVCRLPYASGKSKIHTNVYVSEDEKRIIKILLDENVDVFIQAVPDDEAVHMKDILGW